MIRESEDLPAEAWLKMRDPFRPDLEDEEGTSPDRNYISARGYFFALGPGQKNQGEA